MQRIIIYIIIAIVIFLVFFFIGRCESSNYLDEIKELERIVSEQDGSIRKLEGIEKRLTESNIELSESRKELQLEYEKLEKDNRSFREENLRTVDIDRGLSIGIDNIEKMDRKGIDIIEEIEKLLLER